MFNLMQILGNTKKDNSKWNSTGADFAGELGVKVRESPNWLSRGRPFTLGNNIFMPKNYENPNDDRDSNVDWVVNEELPHVTQFRNEGVPGFFAKHAKDLFKHGAGEQTYYEKGNHESFHFADPDERNDLMSQLEPAQHDNLFDYAKNMFSKKPIDKLANTGKIDDIG